MKQRLTTAVMTLALALSTVFPQTALAQAKADRKVDAKAEKQRAEEIVGHRAMAAAHENAARCLESGKTEKECHVQLEKECRGLGIGKHCGMKHRH